MLDRKVLLPLGALLALCFIGSGALKNKHTGALHILANVSWLGFLALTLFFIIVAVMSIIRNRRRLQAGAHDNGNL